MGVRFLLITGSSLASIAATIAFLTGCMNPGIKDLTLYRVNATLLANHLHEIVESRNNSNARNLNLGQAQLPSYWYWGMSGVCDVYEGPQATNRTNRCHGKFPSTKDLLTIVSESLQDLDIPEKETKSIISSWNTTLGIIPSSILADKESKYVGYIKASAGLAILAIIFDSFAPVSVFLLDVDRHRAYILPLLGGLITIAAGVLATQSMYNGPHEAVDTGEHGGGGIIILFVGAALNLGATLLAIGLTDGPRGQSLARARHLDHEQIGYLGEKFVYEYFSKNIPGWNYGTWTSKLRNRIFPEFTLPQEDYADLTYTDTNGAMHSFLSKNRRRLGIDKSALARWSIGTTYHFEVKSTPNVYNVPFYPSKNQVKMMEEKDQSTTDAYIVVRVFYCAAKYPRVKFYTDPWSRIQRGEWVLGPLNRDGGYPVYMQGLWKKVFRVRK